MTSNPNREMLREKMLDLQNYELLTEIRGCSDAEISEIEMQYNVQLPGMYREFLKLYGNSEGDFLRGDDLFYPRMLGLKEALQGCIDENQEEVYLDGSHFVFAGHEGYSFLFFNTNDGQDDPPVYRYVELEGQPKQVCQSFSAWLERAIRDEITLERNFE